LIVRAFLELQLLQRYAVAIARWQVCKIWTAAAEWDALRDAWIK